MDQARSEPANEALHTEYVDDAATAGQAMTEFVGYASATTQTLLTRPVGAALIWLALPVLGEQTLYMLVGLVDMFLAGKLGKEASSAVGLATYVTWLAQLLFAFVGAGATALVSRHSGMGRPDQSNHFANQSLAAAAFIGSLVYALIALCAPLLTHVLGWEPEPARVAVQFLRINAASLIVSCLTIIAGACWRGMGDTRTPLYVMCVVNVVNIGMATLLCFGWGPIRAMGSNGIALGALIAQITGGAVAIWLLIRGRSGIRFRRPDLRFRAESMKRIFRIGLPAGVDGIFMWGCQFTFLMIISRLATGEEKTATVAAHFVGIRAESLSYLPAFAWATAAATLVGQSLGAGDVARARRCGHLAALQSACLCAFMGMMYFFFAHKFYAVFNSSGDLARVARIGVPALRGLGLFQLPAALMIVYTIALRGAGDTRYPLLFTLIGMVAVRLPLAYLCGIVLHGGLIGAWIGMYADMTTRACLSTIRFVRGQWVHVRV
jgi:putative MATE family efflux protein